MSLFVPRRIESEELLDEMNAPREDMERSLRDLRFFNRYLGGISIYRRLLRQAVPLCRSIIDLGAGTADLVASVDVPLRVAVDFKIQHLQYGRSIDGPGGGLNQIRRVVADGFRLPFKTSSIDVVTSAHFFHHFSPQENVEMLREATRVARKAVVINDTRRNVFPLLFVKLLGVLGLVGRITKNDAPASVQQAYTVEEIEQVIAKSGARQHRIRRAAPFRFGLIVWK